jgi:hypothetical protein
MFVKIRLSHWLIGAVILAAAECASVAAIEIALTLPAQAQRADDRYPFLSRQRQQGGFFGGVLRRRRRLRFAVLSGRQPTAAAANSISV